MNLPTVDLYMNDDDDDDDDNNDDPSTQKNTLVNSSTSSLSPKYNYDKEEYDDDDDDDDQQTSKKPRIHIEYKSGDEKMVVKEEDGGDEERATKQTYTKKFDDENKDFVSSNEKGVDDDYNDNYHDEDEHDEHDDHDDHDDNEKDKDGKRKTRREYGVDEENNVNDNEVIIDDDEYEDEKCFQKFRDFNRSNYVSKIHPECIFHCMDEISAMLNVIRDEKGNVVDPLHRSIPLLTKYERARILGVRSKQLENGAEAFVPSLPEKMIDSYAIAEFEMKAGKLPFIIRRPLAGGGMEYWRLKDLEDLF